MILNLDGKPKLHVKQLKISKVRALGLYKIQKVANHPTKHTPVCKLLHFLDIGVLEHGWNYRGGRQLEKARGAYTAKTAPQGAYLRFPLAPHLIQQE